MGKKDMIKMKLTPEEATIIENIRALQSQVNKSDDHVTEELRQKYMDMDDDAFMTEFRQCMGDEIVLEGVQETYSIEDLLTAIVPYIDAEDVDTIFCQNAPEDLQNEMFMNYHGKEILVERLVDLIMDGDWTPEN